METLQRTANRGSISTANYEVDNSVKLQTAGVNSEFFNRTFSSASNRKTWTFSTWCKRTTLGSNNYLLDAYNNSNTFFILGFSDVDDIVMYDIASGTDYGKRTTAVYRDPSAWYHIVFVSDTTNGTAGDRQRLYVNGVRVTDFDTDYGDPPEDYDGSVNDDIQHRIGSRTDGDTYFSGYLAETCLVDGTALDPDSFGKFDSNSGIWIPIDITGLSVGTNGVLMKYENASSMGAASSGTAFSVQNINQNDQSSDTPTNNFCTINPLVDNNFSIWSLTQGGTRGPNTGETNCSVGTFAVSSGKWYWEGVTTAFSGTNYWKWGVIRADVQQGNSADPATDAGSSWYTGDNAYYTQTSTSASSVAYNTGFTGYTAGDIWSISLNCDVSPYVMTFRINNSVPGTSANNTDRSVGTFASSGPVVPFFMLYNSSSDDTWHNFGSPFLAALKGGNSDANGYGEFKYEPPSGYYALCSKNLAEYG